MLRQVGRRRRRPEQLSESLYVFRDACNVYVIRHEDSAVLVDSGSGAIWGHLPALGINKVDWVIHTHHHRDQCLGTEHCPPATRIAVPKAEARQFRDAEGYWQGKALFNLYECGSDFNSPAQSLLVDRELAPYEHFVWNGIEFVVVPTPGHTKGSTTYVASIDGRRVAFCGDMTASPDGRLDTIYDLQWDCVYPDGLNVALHSVKALKAMAPDALAPSHGAVINDPPTALAGLAARIGAVRDVIAERFDGGTSDPTRPGTGEGQGTSFAEISEHVIAVTHGRGHFYVVRDDDGNGLLFDYGFATEYHARSLDYFVPHSLRELRERFGVERIEVVVPTHFHHDHVAGLRFLQREHATKVWAHEAFADILSAPASYHLPALWHEPVQVDRVLAEGEVFTWRGLDFTTKQTFGHTWYQCVTVAEIDGIRFAITGDALFQNGRGLLCGGAPMYRNRVESDSFSKGLSTIADLSPEILLTGHCGAVSFGPADLEGARAWSLRIEQAWRDAASVDRPVEFALDPDVIRVNPYSLTCIRGQDSSIEVNVRNHFERATDAWLCIAAPSGWSVEPEERELKIEGRSVGTARFQVRPGPAAIAGARHVLIVHALLGERILVGAAEGLIELREA